jgi:uridine phosphorylase
MARPRKNQMKICTVTGVTTSVDNFYRNQSHVKAVDNIRRNTSASKEQLKRMFNQLNAY